MAQYMMGHCHLGPFEVPCEDDLEDCPLCKKLYLDDHVIGKYVALGDVRDQWVDVGDGEYARVSVAAMLPVRDLSSRGIVVSCNSVGLLVIGRFILVLVTVFAVFFFLPFGIVAVIF